MKPSYLGYMKRSFGSTLLRFLLLMLVVGRCKEAEP